MFEYQVLTENAVTDCTTPTSFLNLETLTFGNPLVDMKKGGENWHKAFSSSQGPLLWTHWTSGHILNYGQGMVILLL